MLVEVSVVDYFGLSATVILLILMIAEVLSGDNR